MGNYAAPGSHEAPVRHGTVPNAADVELLRSEGSLVGHLLVDFLDRSQAYRPDVSDVDVDLLHGRHVARILDASGIDRAGQDHHGRADLQRRLHDARRHHDVLVRDAGDVGVARQLLLADHDRRQGRAVPAHQPVLVVAIRDRCADRHGGAVHRRRPARHRLDLLRALQRSHGDQRHAGRVCGVRARLLVHPDGPQLRDHDPPHARAGHEFLPHAALRVVAVRHRLAADRGDAGDRHHAGAHHGGALVRHRRVRPRQGRRPDPLPAPVLDLFAPRRLHHDPARAGRHLRHLLGAHAAHHLRLQVHRHVERRHRTVRLGGVGAPHVRQRSEPGGELRVLAPDDGRRHPQRHQGLQLGGDPVQGIDSAGDADAVRARVHLPVHDRRLHGHDDRRAGGRRARARHLFHRRALPLRHLRRTRVFALRRVTPLVPEDVRQDVPPGAVEDRLVPDLRRLQHPLSAHVHPGVGGHAAALLRLLARVPEVARRLDGRLVDLDRRDSPHVQESAALLEDGKPCTELDPWGGGRTLEWTVPSPPPLENFREIPTITHGPYDLDVPEHK